MTAIEMSNEEITNILRSVFLMELLQESFDEIEGEYLWKHEVKRTGNIFRTKLDKVINSVLSAVDQEEMQNFIDITTELREKLKEIKYTDKQ